MKIIISIAAALLLRPVTTYGQGLTVPSAGTGLRKLIAGIIDLLSSSIIPVCIAIFLVGVLTYVFSAIHEESRSKGKSIMIGALIGAVLGSGAEAILNFILYVLFAPPG